MDAGALREAQRLDLKLRPTVLEWLLGAVLVAVLAVELFLFLVLVYVLTTSVVDALDAPGHPRWWAALGWAVFLAIAVAMCVGVAWVQLQFKTGNPVYLFRRWFTSRLVVDGAGVELSRVPRRRWAWSEIAGFEVLEIPMVFPPAMNIRNEVRAVMRLESGQTVELPALGAFDEGWRMHIKKLEERVNKLTILQIDAR